MKKKLEDIFFNIYYWPIIIIAFIIISIFEQSERKSRIRVPRGEIIREVMN